METKQCQTNWFRDTSYKLTHDPFVNYYKVATLSKLFITVTGVLCHLMPKFTLRCLYKGTGEHTLNVANLCFKNIDWSNI